MLQFVKSSISIVITIVFVLFINSCQKDEILKEPAQKTNTYSTTIRNGTACDNCPNLIVNGDFSDVCEAQGSHFMITDCVGGEWNSGYGTSDVFDNELNNSVICLTNDGNNVFHRGSPTYTTVFN